MAEYTDADFNRDNLMTGVDRLGRQRAPLAGPDVSRADFEYRTDNKMDFLTSYIANLLDRIERLERGRDTAAQNAEL